MHCIELGILNCATVELSASTLEATHPVTQRERSQHSTAQHSTARHAAIDTAQPSTAQHATLPLTKGREYAVNAVVSSHIQT